MNLTADRQVCVIKAVAYSLPTDRQTPVTWTDKSLKTEGPKILSNYNFCFKTVIIGGPIYSFKYTERLSERIQKKDRATIYVALKKRRNTFD